jgi:hypothetical protein
MVKPISTLSFGSIFLLDNRNRKKRTGHLGTKNLVAAVFQKEEVVFCEFEKTDFDCDFEKTKCR